MRYTASTALECCQRCLSVEPGDPDDVDATPRWMTIHARFPTGTEGVAVLLLIERLDSLALNRREIESLVEYLEANGVDIFLTLDRLVTTPEIEPFFDLGRRCDQLNALLD